VELEVATLGVGCVIDGGGFATGCATEAEVTCSELEEEGVAKLCESLVPDLLSVQY